MEDTRSCVAETARGLVPALSHSTGKAATAESALQQTAWPLLASPMEIYSQFSEAVATVEKTITVVPGISI